MIGFEENSVVLDNRPMSDATGTEARENYEFQDRFLSGKMEPVRRES